MEGHGIPAVKPAANGIAPPSFELPYPDSPEVVTANMIKLTDLVTDERKRFLFKNLVAHVHQFVRETSLTTEEWENAIQFLTKVGQTCTPLRQEFVLLSDVLGVSALVDSINNPPYKNATEGSVLGPFFTEDAPHLEFGESIASEGKGEYLWVEGRVLSVDGTPIPNAVIDTWETDADGYYDTQYSVRNEPDMRGQLLSDKDGKYGYRAVVPIAYAIPADGPVGDLLVATNRHNMRPNHLHVMVRVPGYRKLVTAWYPEGDEWLESDAVFGVKKSLVVKMETVKNEAEARKRGFPQGDTFKLLQRDLVLVPEAQAQETYKQNAKAAAKNASL